MSRYAGWGIIIDDIVFPDGRTAMGVLGGGGFYATVGMRIWSPEVMLISAVGDDFDPDSLAASGLDGKGLFISGLPTPRAWQLFEEDGRRTQIFRVPEEVWQQQLVQSPSPETIPASLEAAHFLGRGDPREETFVFALHQAGIRLSAEPIIDALMTADEKESMLRCLAYFEIFSPGPEEAALLTGLHTVEQQLPALAAMGPQIVALRRGARGSIVYERERDRFWRVPAAPAQVVDVTGAGNAYCGGLLVGWVEQGDVLTAAAQAAVSAAIIIEQIGPPPIDEALLAGARQRREKVLRAIEKA